MFERGGRKGEHKKKPGGTPLDTPVFFFFGLRFLASARPSRTGAGVFSLSAGESREPKPTMVVAPDADGRQRHYRTLDEKLVPMKPTTLGTFSARRLR